MAHETDADSLSRPSYLALGDGWELWRLVAVRGAGFPFSEVLRLATPGLAEAADRLLAAERDGAAREAALEAVREAWEEAGRRTGEAAERIFADPGFREALTWQNRSARSILAGVASRPAPGHRNQARRRFEELVARYLQRYAAKNDTIGFFGPVGWATLRGAGAPTRVEPGERLVASRTVSFELWALEAFAAAAAGRHGLLPQVPPVRSPAVRLDGRTAHRDRGAPVSLTPAEAAVLARCDGTLPAARIAAELVARPHLGPRRDGDVYLLLERLQARGLLTWELTVPLDLRPECRLRERLETMPGASPALDELDQLLSARDRVAGADTPERLDAALAGLDATFTRLTGAAPSRRPGQEYAGRSLVYLDARRDLRLELGPEVVDALGPPLELVLRAARWLTAETARVYEEALLGIHRRLATETSSPAVPMSELWFWSQGLFFAAGARPDGPVRREFRRRWEALLADAPGPLAAAALRPAVERAFPSARPRWPAARYHSFDVQVAAADVERLRSGRFQLVMGEAHFALNPVGIGVFQSQHPDPDELTRYGELDVPEDRVVLALPRDWPRFSTRTIDLLPRPRDIRLSFAPAPPAGAGRDLALADLVVEECRGGLAASTRDGGLRLPVVHLLGDLLSVAVTEAFKELAERRHVPRTTIDRLVLMRESWAFGPRDLGFAVVRAEADRFVAARRWAASAGLPRFVFARVPGELKPFFVDFDSLTYVNVLAGRVRRAAGCAGPVVVSEMLPGPDGLWLPDAGGRRYSAELRVVAVDRT